MNRRDHDAPGTGWDEVLGLSALLQELDLQLLDLRRPLLRLLPPLAHHDDRGLNGGKAEQQQVEQNVGIAVEGIGSTQAIDEEPCAKSQREDDSQCEDDEEWPSAAECGKPVRETFPERAVLVLRLLSENRVEQSHRNLLFRTVLRCNVMTQAHTRNQREARHGAGLLRDP